MIFCAAKSCFDGVQSGECTGRHLCPAREVRTSGCQHRLSERRRCTQARHRPPQDRCAWSGVHGSRSSPAMRSCRTACLKTLPGMSIPPQCSMPKSPPLWPPSRTEFGMGRAMHLQTTPQLFTAHAGRQSLSRVLTPGCSQQGSPPAAQHPEIASSCATIPHGALHRSCLATVQQPEPGPCPSPRQAPGALRDFRTAGSRTPTQHAVRAAVLFVRHHHGIGGVSADERNSSAGPFPLSPVSPRGVQGAASQVWRNHPGHPHTARVCSHRWHHGATQDAWGGQYRRSPAITARVGPRTAAAGCPVRRSPDPSGLENN
jgi:hypothetical protein